MKVVDSCEYLVGIQKSLYGLKLCFLGLMFFGFLISLLWMIWHGLTPSTLHFLSASQIEQLQTVLSGVWGTLCFQEVYEKSRGT